MSESDAVADGGYFIAQDLVQRLVEALHDGRLDEATRACTADAVWWLPVDDGDRLPVPDAFGRLTALLDGADRVGPASLVVSPDGGVVVVEQVVRQQGRRTPTPVTSVVYVHRGQVISGRTYLDIAAWASSANSGQQP